MNPKPKNPLNLKPTRFRTGVARGIKPSGDAPAVDFAGGDNGAGLIRGAAIATRGEALGHGLWLDNEFLGQVARAMAAAGDTGSKVRFTHPSMSSDGLGSYLGRAKNPALDGDIVRGDVHFARSAHDAPQGDMAGYVLDLAQEDPAAFGLSIVFEMDLDAQDAFIIEHGGEAVDDPDFGEYVGTENFVSPDPLNVDNLPHARLAEFYGADFVDEPAANPDGLFHRQPYAREAHELLSYSLGLSKKLPRLAALSVDPDRAAQFIRRFLDNHNLELVPKGAAMEPKPAATPAAAAETPIAAAAAPATIETEFALTPAAETQLAAAGQKKCQECGQFSMPTDDGNCAKCGKPFPKPDDEDDDSSSSEDDGKYGIPRTGKDFLAAFGEFGAVCFAEGKTWDETQSAYVAKVQAENAALKAKLAAVPEQFGEKPLSGNVDADQEDPKQAELERKLGSANLAKFAASIVVPAAK